MFSENSENQKIVEQEDSLYKYKSLFDVDAKII